MCTVTDAITRQVSEQVRRAIEAANLARLLSHFNYTPANGGEPSHQPERILPLLYIEWGREWSALYRAARSTRGHGTQRPPCAGGNDQINNCFHALCNPVQADRLGEGIGTDFQASGRSLQGHPMLRRPPPMTTPPKPQNARKYCEFHEQSGHTTTECRELKKAFPKLADKVLNESRVYDSWGLCGGDNPVSLEGSAQKHIASAYHGARTPCNSTHNANSDRHGKLGWYNNLGLSEETRAPRCDIVPLVCPSLGLGKREVNPTGMICPSVHFGNKLTSKSLEVNFLVVDAPTTCNVILGRPTLRRGHGPHRRPADAHPRSGGRPQNSYAPKTLGPMSLGLCINTRGSLAWATSAPALASASSSWRCNPFFSASRMSRSALNFSQRRWYRVTSPSNLWHSAAALTPRANSSAMAISSSVILGASKAPGVTKSHDLTKSSTSENLAAGSALMKLVYGHWVIEEEPLAACS
ncbi:hypothetical protein Cgig2_027354 [Carnegiea gigantea]|uniref:Uncharacterized protein n=1 Tax=Carnegiea gigantea TaxID=171969 RepID=A0A9Q1K8H4_9CARY|nr:hypothetical protein Cgig2_027354 [Carnegiea gigantea]